MGDNGDKGGVGVHVVGPAARLDERDAKDPEREAWTSVRDTVVSLSKRLRITEVEKAGPLAAPSVIGTDDDEAYSPTNMVEDALEPPFAFDVLSSIYENSGALRQNVDGMATNVDGFGHRFVPVLDFKGPEINNQLRDLMLIERIMEEGAPDDLMDLTIEQIDELTPTVEEVEERKRLWESISTIEKGRVKSFFEYINPVEPMIELRKATREDMEILGNAGWEVLRDDPLSVYSKISQVYHVPFANVKLIRVDKVATPVNMTVRVNEVHFEEVEVHRFFRRFVRTTGSRRVYYKEFGDPRIVSRDTGKYYKTVEDLRREENKKTQPANELHHWKIRSPVSAYGVTRWIGALLSVLGSRASEEVNFLYFDNKAIPPMVLLVSGGRVSEGAIERLETYVQEKLKGRENFHKIMIIEAVPAGEDETSGDLEHSGKLRLELKPLMSEQPNDALFQKYDQNNILKIGRSFRQPQILTGDTRDMNRSTAEVAKALAEEQVYQPERDRFDASMDRHYLTNLKVHFWRFRTNAPVQRFPNDLVTNVKKSLDGGAITPNEGRVLLSDAFSEDLDYIDQDWASVPPKLALAAARTGAMASAEPTEVEARAAGEVPHHEGEVVARGRTGKTNDHDHAYVAVKDGGKAHVLVMPAGEDGHSHVVASVEAGEGAEVSVELSSHVDHSHPVKFSVPLSKRTQLHRGFLAFVHEVSQQLKDQIEDEQTEFFDASSLDG